MTDEPSHEDRAASTGRMRWLPALLAVALLPLLGGCIAAAVAVPVIAAAGVANGGKVRAATPVPGARGGSASATQPRPAPAGPDAASGAQLTTLTELPLPSDSILPIDPWQAFVSYALDRAQRPGQSVLLAPENAPSLLPRLRDCPESEPAVIVDLDTETTAFSPATARTPSPGLAEGLARLRAAGVIVLWISQIDANAVREVADALVLSGLDPTGRDPLLLMRSEEDRKQTLRNEANLDVCVIAIAGDRRGDFDELFDYLRDPNSASGLEGMIGSGWFLTPAPFGTPPAP